MHIIISHIRSTNARVTLNCTCNIWTSGRLSVDCESRLQKIGENFLLAKVSMHTGYAWLLDQRWTCWAIQHNLLEHLGTRLIYRYPSNLINVTCYVHVLASSPVSLNFSTLHEKEGNLPFFSVKHWKTGNGVLGNEGPYMYHKIWKIFVLWKLSIFIENSLLPCLVCTCTCGLPSITKHNFLHTCINTAGQETTALMLTFTIIELGRHPEVRTSSQKSIYHASY